MSRLRKSISKRMSFAAFRDVKATDVVQACAQAASPNQPSQECLKWQGQIGQYDNAKAGVKEEEAKKTPAESLSEEAKEILHKGCIESTTHREKFLEHLDKIKDSNKEFKNDPPKLKELIGHHGVLLYKKAIKEEQQSKEFRDKVFNEAANHYDGPKWDKRLVLHIGGPSASGKSFATKMMVEQLNSNPMLQPKDNNNNEGNTVVSIDGGIEREFSQMKGMVLQLATSQGLSGIKDLHKQSAGLSSKGIVEKAATAQGHSIVIPATYTKTVIPWNRKKLHEKMMKYDKDDNVVQVFSMVEGSNKPQVEGEPNSTHRAQTAVMGDSRAWYRAKAGEGPQSIEMNAPPSCESKKYQAKYYDDGVHYSNQVKSFFEENCKNSVMMTYNSDLMHVKNNSKANLNTQGQDSTDWKVCGKDDKFDKDDKNYMRISARDFNAFNKFNNEIIHGNIDANVMGLKEWTSSIKVVKVDGNWREYDPEQDKSISFDKNSENCAVMSKGHYTTWALDKDRTKDLKEWHKEVSGPMIKVTQQPKPAQDNAKDRKLEAAQPEKEGVVFTAPVAGVAAAQKSDSKNNAWDKQPESAQPESTQPVSAGPVTQMFQQHRARSETLASHRQSLSQPKVEQEKPKDNRIKNR